MDISVALELAGKAILIWVAGYGLGISLRAVRQLLD